MTNTSIYVVAAKSHRTNRTLYLDTSSLQLTTKKSDATPMHEMQAEEMATQLAPHLPAYTLTAQRYVPRKQEVSI